VAGLGVWPLLQAKNRFRTAKTQRAKMERFTR
jgi:hypothetical protein